MSIDSVVINEIASNQRLIEHPEYGNFVIKRPTYSVEAQVETARARSINADLQARDSVEDPLTGERREVPAFLTRKTKADQLQFHGLWGESEENQLNLVSERYRKVALELDEAGYEGTESLEAQIDAVRRRLESISPGAEEIAVICPVLDKALETGQEDHLKAYRAARKALATRHRSMGTDEALNDADRLHKQIQLYGEGLQAQAELYALRLNEITLFAETIEARADRAGQVAKVFYCTTHPVSGKSPWKNMFELMDQSPEKVRWLLSEIEKFERMDPMETEEDRKRRTRFDFLGLQQMFADAQSADSPAADQSKPDGDSVPETSGTSTEPLVTVG